jgi:iron complex outermembrane receptor protein
VDQRQWRHVGYTVSERTTTINGVSGMTGYDGSTYYFGKDLNGDGDKLDTVRLIAPSQTKTIRLGLIASLRYDISRPHDPLAYL